VRQSSIRHQRESLISINAMTPSVQISIRYQSGEGCSVIVLDVTSAGEGSNVSSLYNN
jgi:hypothetical protein